MGDFFTPQPGSPLPPAEPDSPPPLFEQLGANLGLGLAKTGTLSAFWLGFADALWNAVARIIGYILKALVAIFVFLMGSVGEVPEEARDAIGLLTAATLKELFGADVAAADVSGAKSGPGRQEAANKMGQALVGTMFAGTTAQPGGGVVPSANAADTFLAAVMKLELNGWLESWVSDGLSAHFLEKYGDLKDGISRSLGLGRLSRQVFRAPLKILVSDPYTSLLNQKYRPRHWDIDALMAQLNRGQITRAQLSTPLGNQGYTEAQIDELVRKSQKQLSIADLEYKHSRGVLGDNYIHDALLNYGYTDGGADDLIDLWRDKRIQKYRMELVSVGEGAYVAGNLDIGQFHTIVTQCGLSAEEQDWIIQVAQLKRVVKVHHLSEGEIIKGIEDGILNFNDLKAWAVREGVPLQDELVLELETQYAENKASALARAKTATAKAKVDAANAKLATAREKATAAQAEAADRGLTAKTAATLVKEQIWTMAQYRAFLETHGYGPDAVQASVDLLNAQLHATVAKTAAAGATRATAVAKGLNLAQIEKAVVEGIVTVDRLEKYLTQNGFSPEDAQVIIDLTQHELTAAQVKQDAVNAAHAKAATKSISIPDLDRAVRLGLTTADTYTAALKKAGFDAASIALLTGILQSQLSTDKAAAAKSAAASGAVTSKGITIGQLASEVVAGIRPIGDYGAALAAAGYGHEDQVELTQLLQLRVDQAASTEKKRAAAAAALDARGISLQAAERAVKLGVVGIGVYQALLRSLHYTPDAIDVLSNTLLAELAATKRASVAAAGASKALAAKSISLPDLERAVIAGIQPIQTYVTTLTNNGYSAGDVDTLKQLLQLKVDQAARAAAAHADAEGAATRKGIELGKEEAAVIAGIKSMEDYDALLSALGYDDVDRATLEALLQAKVDAKAAKDGGGGAGGSAAN